MQHLNRGKQTDCYFNSNFLCSLDTRYLSPYLCLEWQADNGRREAYGDTSTRGKLKSTEMLDRNIWLMKCGWGFSTNMRVYYTGIVDVNHCITKTFEGYLIYNSSSSSRNLHLVSCSINKIDLSISLVAIEQTIVSGTTSANPNCASQISMQVIIHCLLNLLLSKLLSKSRQLFGARGSIIFVSFVKLRTPITKSPPTFSQQDLIPRSSCHCRGLL